MAVQTQERLSVEDYLALERQADTRSEYLDGERFAMSGASVRHNRIVRNVVAALHGQLKTGDCEVFANDLRVRIPATDLYTYPDVVVLCGEPELDDRDPDTLLNPTLIIEVLSKSTQDYDRGSKFAHYRTLATLSDYVLMSQDRVHVEHFARQPTGQWLLTELERIEEGLDLPSIGCRLQLADAYHKVR